MVTETRYAHAAMWTCNTITSLKLIPESSPVGGEIPCEIRGGENTIDVYYRSNIYKRDASGVETLLFKGVAEVVHLRTDPGTIVKSASFNQTLTLLQPTDAIVWKFEHRGSDETEWFEETFEARHWATCQLNASQLNAITCWLYYRLQRVYYSDYHQTRWSLLYGFGALSTRWVNFSYEPAAPPIVKTARRKLLGVGR